MNRVKREQLICDAALKVLARNGYARTSVSEIIEEASVARGTFYLYYKSKQEVFHDLLKRFLEEVARTISRITAYGNEPLAQALAALMAKNRLLTKLILSTQENSDEEGRFELEKFFGELHQLIGRHFQDLMRVGVVREMPVEVLAHGIVGAAREMARESLVAENPILASKIEALIDLFSGGLILQSDVSLAKAISEEDQKQPVAANINWH